MTFDKRFRLSHRLSEAFRSQSKSCASLGSTFTASLMLMLPSILPSAPRLFKRLCEWSGDVSSRGASLPLRVAGGLHFLVRVGEVPDLAKAYPPNQVGDLESALRRALEQHDDWLCEWVELPPQTNEVGRSAVLIAAARWITENTGFPLRLSELGASAGLNLNFDHYALLPNGSSISNEGGVLLRPDWSGKIPQECRLEIVERRGVDLSPMEPSLDAERLIAYIWPDQLDRLERVTRALELARKFAVPVDKGEAADWLSERLTLASDSSCHFVFHTIAHQYFPDETKAMIEAEMQSAGSLATSQSPLAWFGMEADADPNGAALSLRLWPGDQRYSLGRAGFHGQWVNWKVQRLD